MKGMRIREYASITLAAMAWIGAPEGSAAQSSETADVAAMETPTYYGAAKAALDRNCVTCHQADAPDLGGMKAPMSLTTYRDARRWAARIAEVVSTGYMPPWDADVQHQGLFKNERYISEEDQQALVAWAEGGALEGDPSMAVTTAAAHERHTPGVEPVVLEDGSVWLMGEPDLIVGFEEPILVCDAVEDWQPQIRMHVQEGQLTEPKWIRGMEIKPGSPIVHHTVSSHLGVGVPGRGPFLFPEGWGILLTEDPFISINMHYHKDPGEGTAVYDDTKGAFSFYEPGEVVDYLVETELQPFTDFVIPAGHPNYEVRNETHFEEDIYLLSMGPHAHYRGKAVKIELERPDRPFRETLLWVPDYDFNWQFQYELKEPYHIPAGSTMHITWWYDNSADNPYNPDPMAEVRYGPATTDEMMNARIYFARTEPLGLRVGDPIPPEILERSLASEERERSRSEEWDMNAPTCPVPADVATR